MIFTDIILFLKPVLHYFLHLVFPFLFARIFFRMEWKKAGLVMFLTIIVDADHLLATPVFDPDRCSIGFHPLHSYIAIAVYVAFLFHRKTRYTGTGLLLHMMTDLLDCLL
jgi:hypothetical protein